MESSQDRLKMHVSKFYIILLNSNLPQLNDHANTRIFHSLPAPILTGFDQELTEHASPLYVQFLLQSYLEISPRVDF